jgi:endonuclease V-like protein UPF0215 family
MSHRISQVVGFDDAPFAAAHRGNVLLVGAVYAGTRLEGVLSGQVRRDGANAGATLIRVVSQSRFAAQLQAVLVQGIAFAGFNVIDIWAVHRALALPVIAVSRGRPDMAAVRRALLEHVPGGRRKWRLVEQAGPVEAAGRVFVQRAGIALDDAAALVGRLALNGALPEPLRTAHLIAGGIVRGESRHRP